MDILSQFQSRNLIVGNDLEPERPELPELIHEDCMVRTRRTCDRHDQWADSFAAGENLNIDWHREGEVDSVGLKASLSIVGDLRGLPLFWARNRCRPCIKTGAPDG